MKHAARAWPPILCGVAVFLVALAAFSPGFTDAKAIYFDETWYVPTARTWLATGEMLHQEHPPLGKLMIALSMALFGDNPYGWRALSLLFGAITMFGVWLWTFALTQRLAVALWAAAITALDGIVFVQARIAMLDIFLMAFVALALAFYTFALEARDRRGALLNGTAMGVCLGLAGACKWSGFFLAFGLIAIQALIGLLRLWKVRFDDARDSDFYRPDAPAPFDLGVGLIAFGLAPVLAYFLCYLPQMLHERTILEFFASHKRMFEIMMGHSADHPYMSLWNTWPYLRRPVWYLFDVPGGDVANWSEAHPAAAVVGLPNPIVFFAGELAVLFALGLGIFRRERGPLIVAVAFFAQWLPWAMNPKGLEFFYYFYPSILCFGPALSLSIFRGRGWVGWTAASVLLAVAAASFVFFLPVLASGIGVGPAAFTARVWLPSWR